MAGGAGLLAGTVLSEQALAAGPAINPSPAGESADLVALRQSLNDAANGIEVGYGRDECGRIIVRAQAVRYTLKDTLVIGANTQLDATLGRFVADFPVVARMYSVDASSSVHVIKLPPIGASNSLAYDCG